MSNYYNPKTEDALREEFIAVHKKHYKNCQYKKTKEDSIEDTRYHIDVIITYPDGIKEYVDVKDNLYRDKYGMPYFIAELKTKTGGDGSLYGQQHYFAVKDADNSFVCIGRENTIPIAERYEFQQEEDIDWNFINHVGRSRIDHPDELIVYILLEELFTIIISYDTN